MVMNENENVVPFEVIPQIHTGSFLTKEQAEQFKEAFKDMMVVVRYMDCKHWVPIEGSNIGGTCKQRHLTDANWFCADGKRR